MATTLDNFFVKKNDLKLELPATFEELGMDPQNKGIISVFLEFVKAEELCKSLGMNDKLNCLVCHSPGTDKSSIIAAMADYLGSSILLKNLRLGSKSLHTLPDSIWSLTQLVQLSLNLNGCNLSHLPSEIGNLASLKTLSREGNNICTLPDSISSRTQLVHLSLNGCNLSHLPSEIGNLASLKTLSLEGNNICTLPDSISSRTRLVHLSLKGCNLSHLPSEIGNLASLKTLSLEGNNICTLPDSISSCTRLEHLSLKGCNLSHLPSEITLNHEGNNICTKLERLRSFYVDCASSKSIPLEFNQLGLEMRCTGTNKLAENNFANPLPKLTLSDLLESIHGLLSSCGDERIIIRATNLNHIDRVDAALLHPLNIDSENKNRGEALKRECITKSILGLEDLQQHFSGRRDDAANNFGATRISKKHGTNRVSIVKRIHNQHGIQQWPFCQKSRWAKLCLLWKAARAYTATAKEFRGANAKVNFLLVEENSRNPDIKKGNCNQSSGTLTTVESSSRDDCAGMPPDLKTSKRSSWASLRLLWKAARAFAAAKEFRSTNAEVDFLLVEEKNRNLDIKKGNCNQSSSIVTTVESSSRDDIAGLLPDLNTSKRSSWANLRLLWKAASTFTAAFHSKKGNRNQSPSTVATVESSSRDDCAGMFPDLNTSESASSSTWPIGLLDGGNVVLLDPLEQPIKTAAHAAKEDLCSPIESPPKKKMVRKSLRRKCRIMSLIFEDHRQHFGRRCEGTAKSLGVTRICMKHEINRVSSVNRIHKPHGINWWSFRQKWARRKGCSLGGERTFDVSCLSVDDILDSRLLFFHMPQFARSSLQTLALPYGGKIVGPVALSSSELAATNNRAHYVRQDQNGYTTCHYEWKSTRVTSDRQGIAMSLRSVKDLHQYFGCKRKDVVKRLGVNIPMFKRTCRQHRIYCRPCWLKNNDSLVRNSLEVLDVLPLWEESNTIEHLVPRRRLALQQRWIRPKKSLDLPRTLQMNCTRGLTVQSGTPLHWSDGLPDGGQVVSLSEKEIVRKTLKRKCRTTKVPRLEYHQLHFDSRCQDAAKRHGAKRICRQHVINQVSTVKCIHRQHAIHWWPFRKKWAMMKVYSLEGQRPLEVISPSTGRKLVSRLQVIHVSWLGRSSPGSSAIPGGEIVGFIALSSSGFAATNNRANLLGQNPSGSTASHSNKKRQRDAAVDKGTNLYISEQDLQQHFGLTREEAARRLGVSVTTFKRHCRKHGILRWPCYRNRSSDIPGRPPDPDERNTYPTCKASTHGQTEMVDHLRNPNEVAPDLLDGIGAFLETPTSPAACAGNNVDMEVFVSSFLEEEMEAIGSYGAAFQPQEQTTVSIAYPTHNYPVCAQPHIAAKEMISENMRSSNLTSQVEARLEWYGSRPSYLAVPTCSNLASSQPMSTIPETRPTVPQSMSTIPEIGPTVSQPMSTIPEIGPTVPQPMSINPRPTVPQPMSTLPDTGPTIMTIKAKYRDSTIKFKLPLTSTLAELNEKVEMRLNLKPGSFDVEYKDEDQDDWNEGWITIACDEDLRDYLQLFSSLENQVIKLLVLDKVVNANDSSGSLKRKRL